VTQDRIRARRWERNASQAIPIGDLHRNDNDGPSKVIGPFERQLLTGIYRILEERKAEAVSWHRRERLADNEPAPSPFYEE